MKNLFLHDSQDDSPIVFSDRVLYTPTSFAKTALLYLQEIFDLASSDRSRASHPRSSVRSGARQGAETKEKGKTQKPAG